MAGAVAGQPGGVAWVRGVAEVQQGAAAKFEITELISRYGNCLDSGDFDELESLFTADAVFRVLPADQVPDLTGSHRIREAIEERWTLVHQRAQRRHVMANIVVESIDDDVATARTVQLHGMGVYEDRLVHSSGAWRFQERCLLLDRTDYFSPGWTSVD